MIALYLLAAHLVGDFVLQTRWQAECKLHDYNVRARHVLAYCVPFLPLAAWRAAGEGGGLLHGSAALCAAAFLAWLAVLHFATDSHRFRSTVGDWLVWRLLRDWGSRRAEWHRLGENGLTASEYNVLPDNPWTPLPIVLDQTLHVVQLAVLAGLFLA